MRKKESLPFRVSLVSLGCPKNLIDSEIIAGHLHNAAYEFVVEPEEADAVVVNTCGFVEAAREESFDAIRRVCSLKATGRPRFVVVAGCLVQRSSRMLVDQLPDVDAFLPITDYSGIPDLLNKMRHSASVRRWSARGGQKREAHSDLGRALLTAPHVSYLRIAEGCNHRCSFCAIPGIRGRLKSKPIDLLVEESRNLASLGVKEINLVAEDTTDYGRDLGGKPLLPRLLRELGRIPKIRWIRLLYAYPSRVTAELIDEMARNPKVLPYIDMPVQHISARILKSMLRGTSPKAIRSVISALRDKIPGIVLRTSIIVGYPGETEAEFNELYDFVAAVRFERLGAFQFSPEEGTAAYLLGDRVPEQVAEERMSRIMTLQREIVEARNKSLVGAVEQVIVDAVFDKNLASARTRADAPDIDCAVRLNSSRRLKVGDLLDVRITGYDAYDLIASH